LPVFPHHSYCFAHPHPFLAETTLFTMKLLTTFRPYRPRQNRRSTLCDLYAYGLISVFRRHSILRVWEPLRETPRRSKDDVA
jgi:hypothetical protein